MSKVLMSRMGNIVKMHAYKLPAYVTVSPISRYYDR